MNGQEIDTQESMETKCGRSRNNRDRKFKTRLDIENHERDCWWCNGTYPLSSEPINLSLTDSIVTDDESDGVYFAIAHEMGEL